MLLLVSASLKLQPPAQLVHDKRFFLHREIGHRPSALIDYGLDFTRLLGQRVERIVCPPDAQSDSDDLTSP
jgi:hypothetical protein